MQSNGIPDAEYQHQLLTLVTLAGLNVALVKRRLIRQVPFDPAAAIEMLKRVETAHRAIVALQAMQGC